MQDFILDQTLPGLTRQRTSRLIHALSDITCGENCWHAKEEICRCECGGKNHGIALRGENGVRACRMNGYRYELLAIGTRRELLKETERLTRQALVEQGSMKLECEVWFAQSYRGGWVQSSYVHPSEYTVAGKTYILKLASLAQCLKWKELAYFNIADDRDRYHAEPAILWKRTDIPSYA